MIRGPTCTLCLLALVGLAACDGQVNMVTQPLTKTLEASPVFSNGAAARPLVDGVVSTEGRFFTSAPEFTMPPKPPLTMALVLEGQEQFVISCVPCHGLDGSGDGMAVRRGYPKPPSWHTARLRQIEDEHIFRVITDGLGKMPPYRNQVAPADRWAVVAYIRALQLAQYADADLLSPEERAQLDESSSAGGASRTTPNEPAGGQP